MKLGGWVVMIVTMILFLSLIGIETGLNPILSSIGISVGTDSTTADIENSSFWIYLLALLVTVSAGTLVIGLFGKGYDVSLAIAPMIIYVASIFIKTWWSIISLEAVNMWWMQSIVSLVFVGLGIGFIFACYNYFAGR